MLRQASAQVARDGFAVLPDFFSAAQVAAIKRRSHELIAERPSLKPSVFSTKKQQSAPTQDDYFMSSGDAVRFFMEDADASKVNKIGHCLHDRDDVFGNLCYSPQVLELCLALGFEDPRIVQTMYILKGAHTGGEVSAHKDNAFLITQPRLSVCGLWVAVDDATLTNGCMWAVPGSHRRPPSSFFRALPSRAGAGWDDGYDPNEFQQESERDGVPLEARSGSLVVLDGNLVHYSAANTSDQPREAFTMHVAEGKLTWHPDNWLQRPDGFVSMRERVARQ